MKRKENNLGQTKNDGCYSTQTTKCAQQFFWLF